MKYNKINFSEQTNISVHDSTSSKTIFTIPPIVFNIVWPILYLFLLIAMILFYSSPPTNKTIFILWNSFFWCGILFNFLWTFSYFQQKNISASYVLFIFLILFAISTAILFAISEQQHKWICFALFLPYILWLLFAFYYFNRILK